MRYTQRTTPTKSFNMYELLDELEAEQTVEIRLKKTVYGELRKGTHHRAFIDESGAAFVITKKFPLGLYHEANEVFIFKSRGNAKRN